MPSSFSAPRWGLCARRRTAERRRRCGSAPQAALECRRRGAYLTVTAAAATSPMKAAIIIFPGSNREHDVALAWRHATGHEPARVWHREAALPETDLII